MKKLIAISVMIALVVGAVFADTSVAGGIEARVNIYSGQFGDFIEHYDVEDDDENVETKDYDPYNGSFPKPTTNGSIGSAWIQLSGANDDGTLGGTFRLRGTDLMDGSLRWHKAFIWWKPVDVVRMFFGVDADGMFETGQLTSWAFHQGSENFLTVHNWDFWRDRFPGNWDGFGVAFSVNPADVFNFNLVVPIGQPGGWPRHDNKAVNRTATIAEIYPGSLQFTGNINLQDIGKIAISWIGSGEAYIGNDDLAKLGRIGLSFYSNSILDGLAFQLGGAMVLQKGDDLAPINLGVAVAYKTGDIGIKFRLGTDIGLNEGDGMFLTANIMPSYNLDGVGNLCLDFGMSFNKADSDADMDMGFWINPYLKKNISGGYLQTGLMILRNMAGGQGDSHNVQANSRTRVYFPFLMGFNF